MTDYYDGLEHGNYVLLHIVVFLRIVQHPGNVDVLSSLQ